MFSQVKKDEVDVVVVMSSYRKMMSNAAKPAAKKQKQKGKGKRYPDPCTQAVSTSI